MFSSTNKHGNGKRELSAVKGSSLHSRKVSFNTKLICLNEVCPRLYCLRAVAAPALKYPREVVGDLDVDFQRETQLILCYFSLKIFADFCYFGNKPPPLVVPPLPKGCFRK